MADRGAMFVRAGPARRLTPPSTQPPAQAPGATPAVDPHRLCLLASPMSQTTPHEHASEPVLRPVQMHLVRPNEPVLGTITRNELCTASRKAAGFTRHIEIDISGTPLEGQCAAGQSISIIVPGTDDKGRPYPPRLYSLSSPSQGEDGQGRIIATTVKRTIDEHWETHSLFIGLASNYLADRRPGDTVLISGPTGKRFVLPERPDQHDYLFFATGTGVAPFRGFIKELLGNAPAGQADGPRITLVMGASYSTDLLYHDDFLDMQERHPSRFRYLTAISREAQRDGHDRMYVQDRLETHRDELLPMLAHDRTLIYICGVANMELGIFRKLATMLSGPALEQYLQITPEALADINGWDRKMLHRQIKTTRRVMLEVYA
jgi:ferredoxin--NADP+ reductase